MTTTAATPNSSRNPRATHFRESTIIELLRRKQATGQLGDLQIGAFAPGYIAAVMQGFVHKVMEDSVACAHELGSDCITARHIQLVVALDETLQRFVYDESY